MTHSTPPEAPRGAPYRELTVAELHAIAGGMKDNGRGLAPDPHTPDLVQIVLALLKKLT